MISDVVYDEWIPYVDYEKCDCDVKLKDGTIVYHCWANAGKFNPLCSSTIDFVPEEDVAEIRYRRYYVDDLCKSNCNGDNHKGDRDLKLTNFIEPSGFVDLDSLTDWNSYSDGSWSNMLYHNPPYVRQKRKIQRNELCPCDSGKKYKKCCNLKTV